MLKLLATKTDALITIFLIVSASVVNNLFGENLWGVAVTGIIVIAMLIVYDVLRFYIFGKFVIEPLKWLYVSTTKVPFVLMIDNQEKEISPNSTIIILSPDLNEDASSEEVIKIVRVNMMKGVRYVLFTSNSAKAKANLSSVIYHHRTERNMSINIIEETFLKTVMYDNLMIFIDHTEQIQRGFIQIPDGSRMWWAEMSSAHVEECINNINFVLRSEALQHVHGFVMDRIRH